MDKRQIEARARAEARLRGCNCSPDIVIEPDHPLRLVPELQVLHDPWCNVIQRGLDFSRYN